MKIFSRIALVVVCSCALFGQQITNGNRYFVPGTGISTQIANDGTTGTVLNKLAKLNASGAAVVPLTTDTIGIVGIVVGGAGTSGTADVQKSGQASLIFDGATTAGDYVVESTSVAGAGHDIGNTCPSTSQVVGRVMTTNGASGTYIILVGTEGCGSAGSGSGIPPGITYATTALNWSKTSTTPLTAGTQATLTISQCPVGVDTTSGAGYMVYLNDASAEAVQVTGGSCTSGANSGTLIFTPFFSHTSYTIGSASSGIQETINNACGVSPTTFKNVQCNVTIPANGPYPAGTFATHTLNDYNVYGTIYLHASQSTLTGDGVTLNCLNRGFCLQVGDLVNSNDFINNTIKGFSFQYLSTLTSPDTNSAFAGVAITNTQAVGGFKIITTANPHNFRSGDWVNIQFTDDNQYWGDALVADCGTSGGAAACNGSSTSFRIVSTSTASSQATPGVVALAYVAILDNAMGSHFVDIQDSFVANWPVFNHFFDFWDDEDATIDHFNNNGISLNQSANWTGSFIYSGGAANLASGHQLAPVITLQNSNITANSSNGITVYNSNGVYVKQTVIQAAGLWEAYCGNVRGNFQGCTFSDIYNNGGNAGQNPAAGPKTPFAGLGGAGLIAATSMGSYAITGNGGFTGYLPNGGTGATKYTYYIVVRDTTTGQVSSPLPILNWLSTGSDSIPVKWPRVAHGADVMNYDVIRMTTAVNVGDQYPTTAACTGGSGGVCGSVATAISQATACSGGLICTFTDSGSSTTASYSLGLPAYSGPINFWPGGVVAQSNTIKVDVEQGGTISGPVVGVGLVGNPAQVANTCSQFGQSGPGAYTSCLASITTGNNGVKNQTATILTDGPSNTSGNPLMTKGRLTFVQSPLTQFGPHHIITLQDSQPGLAEATIGYRPAASANDVYIGTDQPIGAQTLGQLSFGAPVAISNYIADTGSSSTTWLERLTSAAKTFHVAIIASNGITGNLTGNVTGNVTGNLTGDASTADALSGTPTLCPLGQAPLGILPSGNATGCASIGSGGSMTWPANPGIAIYGGSLNWAASIPAPTGTIVGTTDTQSLTNKTVDGVSPTTFGFLDATSSIQTQINSRAASLNAAFSGVVTGLNSTEVGLGSVTNDLQTKAAIVPNTAPAAGQILAGTGTAYAPVTMSGDCSIVSSGLITCSRFNNFAALSGAAFTGAVSVTSATPLGGTASMVSVTGAAAETSTGPAVNFDTAVGSHQNTFRVGNAGVPQFQICWQAGPQGQAVFGSAVACSNMLSAPASSFAKNTFQSVTAAHTLIRGWQASAVATGDMIQLNNATSGSGYNFLSAWAGVTGTDTFHTGGTLVASLNGAGLFTGSFSGPHDGTVGGTTPAAGTFTTITDAALTAGNCVQAGVGGALTTTALPCGSGGGGGGGITGTALSAGQVAVATGTAAVTSYTGFTSDSSGNVTANSFSTTGAASPDTYTTQAAPATPAGSTWDFWVDSTSLVPTFMGAAATKYYAFTDPGSNGILSRTALGTLSSSSWVNLDPGQYVVGTGTAQAQVLTYSPAVTSLVAGLELNFLPVANNTAINPTLNVNGLGAKTITKLGTATVAASDLTTTAIASVIYDGTRFQLQNPQTSSGGGGVTSFTGDGTIISNSGSTAGVTVTLANAGAGTVLGNATGAAAGPTYTTAPVLGLAGTTVGSIGFHNATSGTVTLSPVAGALGTPTITIPANAQTMVVAPTSTTTTNALFASATAGAPTFRAIATGDIPTLNQNTTGSAANLLNCTPSTAGDVCYWNGSQWTRLAGNASGTLFLQETAAGVPSWASSSAAIAWSGISAPTGNLALSMGANTSTFNTTTAVSQFFGWKNTTAAIVSASQSSPNLALCGTEWHAAASAEGCMNLQFVPGTGTDAANTIAFTHSGSATGLTTTTFPGPLVATTFSPVEATAPTGVASSDILYADSTAHRFKVINNNGTATTPALFTDNLSVFAATSSSQLAGVLNDETGSGLAVFGTSPTLITPILGTPTSETLTNATGLPLAGIVTVAANTVAANVTGSTASLTAAAIPSGIQNYIAGTGYNQASSHQIAAALVCADSSASGTTQVCTTSPSFTPAANDCVIYTTTTANTGASLTLNVNALGAKSVAKWLSSTTLVANDVLANKPIIACYDGTNWEIDKIGNAPAGGGGVTSVATTSPITGGTITTTGTIACATCVTSAASLTSNGVVIGGGSQATSTISADTTTTHAMFATAGAPAFRALASTDLPAITLDKSASGLANPTADATFTYPIGSTVGMTLTGTAPASVSTATGTNASSILVVTAPIGGADSNATGTAGVGGSPAITAGAGGAGTGTNAVGGAGGAVTVTAGAGGASAGTGANSNGGNIVLVPGAVGTGGSGAVGKAGVLQVGSSAPFPVLGTSGGMMFTCGTGPNGIGSNDAFYCDSANQPHAMSGTTDLGIISNQSQTAQITAADWTCGTGGTNTTCVAAQTISTLSFTLPLEAKNWSFTCDLVVGQATAATANSWNIQTATNGATNLEASYDMHTAAAVMTGGALTGVASSTTTQVIGGTWTLGATGTKMPVHIAGTVEGASASGTVLNFQLVAPTVADLVTIYRGSQCRIF